MKVAFTDNYLGKRGTAVALYDFAHFNETILGNQSIILMPRDHPHNDPSVVKKFKDRFQVFEHEYNNIDEADTILKEQGADVLYLSKGNKFWEFGSRIIPNVVHMVFINDPSHYHGDQFAFISDYLTDLAKERFGVTTNTVPWMINIEDTDQDLRDDLAIPKDAFVFGYYGGEDCFGIPWVGEPIFHALNNRPDLHIILMNVNKSMTPLHFDHPRLKFLPGTGDMSYKSKFIKTCNAMLHARQHGETFGLACGEFSRLNRPIVASTQVEDRCHIGILGNKLIGYSNPQELYNILMGLTHDVVNSQDWDCYSKTYSPENAMKKFKEIFLDPYDKNR
jgi:hypothetical protein